MVSQRDIVEVIFRLPQGELKHPVIVLSCNDAISLDQFFNGIMLTSDEIDDEFSFPIEDYMLNKPLSSKSQARLHLIGWFKVGDINRTGHYNHQIKTDYFKQLIKQIVSTTFAT